MFKKYPYGEWVWGRGNQCHDTSYKETTAVVQGAMVVTGPGGIERRETAVGVWRLE